MKAKGGVDIVVHNAGITRDKTLARMSEEQWDQALQVNLGAVVRINEALDKQLRQGGRIIVSSVYRPGVPDATVVWQRLNIAGIAATSAIGAAGATASLPPGLTVDTGENVIVAEVVYDYEPFFFDAIFDPVRLAHDAFNRPRIANLTQITP